jgi:hypothetical protein
MKKIIKSLSLVAIIALIGLTFNSCKKDIPTTVKITVRDANNALVVGAGVTLYVDESSGSLTYTDQTVDVNKTNKYTTTDYKGEATFDVSDIYKKGSAGVAILDLRAVYGSSEGVGVIKIEPETENTETLYIQ